MRLVVEKKDIGLIALLAVLLAGEAQAKAEAPPGPSTELTRLAKLLSGSWRCSGHFSNGKAITSSETFKPILNGRWLVEQHSDDPPFDYQSYALWGRDQAGILSLSVYDSSGGMRLFTSKGWQANALTFDQHPLFVSQPRRERFVYKRTAVGYSIEYDVLDESSAWKMGDVLACTKR